MMFSDEFNRGNRPGELDCDGCRQAIERFVAEELDEASADAVERHIQRCPACAAEIDASLAMDRRLGDAFALASPGPRSGPSIADLAGTALTQGRRRRRHRLLMHVGSVAAAVLLLAVVYVAGRGLRDRRDRPQVAVGRAISDGLNWLAASQSDDGHWEMDHPERKVRFRVGLTALSVLALSTAGETAGDGRLVEARSRGIAWLLDNQQPDGRIGLADEGPGTNYGHAIATLALSEALACGVTVDRRAVQRAVDYCSRIQLPEGSWSYAPGAQPERRGDTSHTGWFVLAMLHAEKAGLTVDRRQLVRARRWIASMTDPRGTVGYQVAGDGTVATTAIGLMVSERVPGEAKASQPHPETTACRMLSAPEDQKTLYFWHFLTRSGRVRCPEHPEWKHHLVRRLADSQVHDTPELAGSWGDADRDTDSAGRVYATAMAVMTLDGLRDR